MGAQRPPVDPDVDLSVPRQRAELRGGTTSLLAAIAVGGMVGALARYGLTVTFPHAPRGFPWATFAVNVSGCLLIGALMVLITEAWTAHRLVRPFLGVGVLGGFTTFSTYAVEVQQAVAAGAARTGLLYLAGTLVAALVAVRLGVTLTRLATGVDRNRSAG
ncbi:MULTISPECIES: fluoride efflux transporter CrcB [unclassified Micromonospora]|uniref:fluoride efflux transporter CrcB n=1 Tax=unclassified Micromonospora TaxID=2617518 RepID=UPI0022B67712|nr:MULTISPECIES: fluoride efflux transporter CrcB [unclassified Micromonospora]MCZ7421262.1 fluoride efflux transporter CrcB [Verrucosispora sp. WMMA2121]WBB94042.1 fluoride efflux transporter CrcB [Verrucosispora sp. WMMC514]